MLNFKKFLDPKIFGLDLTGNIIRVAQMPDKFAFGATIQEAIKKAKIQTKYVNIAMPEAECFVKLVPKDGDIKKEIESNVPLALSEIYYDFKEIGQGLLIVAAKRKIIDKYITELKQAGLIAKAIEPESIAIARALVQDDNNYLIIKVSSQNTLFMIVSSQIIKFTVAGALEQTADYLDFYQTRNGNIAEILLCGDSDLQKASAILKQLNLPIKIVKDPSYTAAIGLALKND
ncbi:MAG: hypothetical protein ABIG90_03320 [bacterium]